MRWFKKAPTPFDEHCSIRVETPPDPNVNYNFFFTIPDWYYAHLIGLQFYYYQPVYVDPMQSYINFYWMRGGVKLCSWTTTDLIKLGYDFNFWLWVGAPWKMLWASWAKSLQTPLPPHLYMYPGDVLWVEGKGFSRNAALRDFRLTFRIWEI